MMNVGGPPLNENTFPVTVGKCAGSSALRVIAKRVSSTSLLTKMRLPSGDCWMPEARSLAIAATRATTLFASSAAATLDAVPLAGAASTIAEPMPVKKSGGTVRSPTFTYCCASQGAAVQGSATEQMKRFATGGSGVQMMNFASPPAASKALPVTVPSAVLRVIAKRTPSTSLLTNTRLPSGEN